MWCAWIQKNKLEGLKEKRAPIAQNTDLIQMTR